MEFSLPVWDMFLNSSFLNPLTTMGHLCPSISAGCSQLLIKIHNWVWNKIKIFTKNYLNAHFFFFLILIVFSWLYIFRNSVDPLTTSSFLIYSSLLQAIFISEQEKNVTSLPLVIKKKNELFLSNRSRDVNFQCFWNTCVPIVDKGYYSAKKLCN